MKSINARAWSAWALLATTTLMSLAVGADEPQRCATMADDRARLACYDSIFGKPAASTPVATPSAAAPQAGAVAGAAAAAPAAAAAVDPEADFGLTEAAKKARMPEETREQIPESISGKVTEVARQPAGELVVTLDNGQVWTQVQIDARARVAVGDTVTIKKAALGSHMLVTASRYATRVRRVK